MQAFAPTASEGVHARIAGVPAFASTANKKTSARIAEAVFACLLFITRPWGQDQQHIRSAQKTILLDIMLCKVKTTLLHVARESPESHRGLQSREQASKASGGSGICEHGKQRGQCKDCKGMAVLSGIAAAVPRRYYPDPPPPTHTRTHTSTHTHAHMQLLLQFNCCFCSRHFAEYAFSGCEPSFCVLFVCPRFLTPSCFFLMFVSIH